jgi:hypothetical protein
MRYTRSTLLRANGPDGVPVNWEQKMRDNTDVSETPDTLRSRPAHTEATMKCGWFVLGTVVGKGLYACLTQKTGSEVRADIADAADQAKDYVQERAKEASQAIE